MKLARNSQGKCELVVNQECEETVLGPLFTVTQVGKVALLLLLSVNSETSYLFHKITVHLFQQGACQSTYYFFARGFF